MINSHKKTVVFLFSFFISFLFLAEDSFAQKADDCSLTFDGTARKKVKLRTASSGSHYDAIENGSAVTVAVFHSTVCNLDEQVPDDVSETKAIAGVETKKVTITAYLLAAKFEKNADHDIHAEISDSPNWFSDHMIIEVPPGKAYCKARKDLWDIITNDGAPMKGNGKILQTPVKITVSGYVFLDATHGNDDRCNADGGRGMHNGNNKGNVLGLYEIHPVLALKKAE